MPVEKRIATARTWSGRIDKLLIKRRKKDPDYSEAQFCRDHDIDPTAFNRNKKLKFAPSKKTVDLYEAAFEAEGV